MSLSWALNDKAMGVTALCVADAAGMIAAFNPPMFTVRTLNGGVAGDSEKSIRLGLILGSAVSLVVGAGGTIATGSWWPLVGTILGLIVICASQEWALRNPQHKGASNG